MLKPIVLIAAVVAIVVCAIIFLWLRSSSPTARGGNSSDADDPGDRDQQTLGRLEQLGSDLTKQHEIEFFTSPMRSARGRLRPTSVMTSRLA